MLKLSQQRFDVEVERGDEKFTLVMTDITRPEILREMRRKEAKTQKEIVEQVGEVLDTLRRHIVDWKGVGDEEGEPVAFSPYALDLLLDDSDRSCLQHLAQKPAGARAGKLKAAARYLVTPDDSAAADEADALGGPGMAEAVRAAIERDRPNDLDVLPENWQAVQLFLACMTQWRIGFAGATGLDYTGCESALRMMQVPRWQWPDTFARLQVLEDEALRTMRKGA